MDKGIFESAIINSLSLLELKGNWDANTNTPALASGVGNPGDAYYVSVAGSTNLDGITDWQVGDIAFFKTDNTWDKIDNTDQVVSVNGRQGVVTGLIDADGSDPLTADWDVGAFDILASEFRARSSASVIFGDNSGNGITIANGGGITVSHNLDVAQTDYTTSFGLGPQGVDTATRFIKVNYGGSPDQLYWEWQKRESGTFNSKIAIGHDGRICFGDGFGPPPADDKAPLTVNIGGALTVGTVLFASPPDGTPELLMFWRDGSDFYEFFRTVDAVNPYEREWAYVSNRACNAFYQPATVASFRPNFRLYFNNVQKTRFDDGNVMLINDRALVWTSSLANTATSDNQININGNWQIIPSGNDLMVQRYESGSWVTKATFSA